MRKFLRCKEGKIINLDLVVMFKLDRSLFWNIVAYPTYEDYIQQNVGNKISYNFATLDLDFNSFAEAQNYLETLIDLSLSPA